MKESFLVAQVPPNSLELIFLHGAQFDTAAAALKWIEEVPAPGTYHIIPIFVKS